MSIHIFCPFFKIGLIVILWVLNIPTHAFIKYVICKYFLPVCGFSFSLTVSFSCRKRYPLQGLETGLLSNSQKWIVWRDTGCWQTDFTGKGCLGREREGGEPRRPALPSRLWLYGDGIRLSKLSLANHSDSSSGTHITQPRWIPARIPGGWWMRWHLLLTFPNSSSCCWLVSSMFLIRTS